MLRFTGWPECPVIGGRNAPEQPAGIVWNKWPESTGTGGRNAPEQVADFSGIRICRTDRQFLIEFEQLLKSEFGRSAFDEPGQWGAKKGKPEQDLNAVIMRLKLGKVVAGTPMSLNEAKKLLDVLL